MFYTDTDSIDAQVAHLRQQIQATEQQLAQLKHQLASTEQQQRQSQNVWANRLEVEWQQEIMGALSNDHHPETPPQQQPFALSNDEFRRFGRQLIMPEIGLKGQLRLRDAKVLIVGAGGLGCPATAYLAGAGVGTIGLIDGDTVEVSNLHRQMAHTTSRVGMSKVDSAIAYCSALNPHVKYIPHHHHLVPADALAIFANYHVVLDCTDHPTSRYLISDACVLAGKPLVSASALRTEGQLTVLNNPPRAPGATDGGPCYRCVFPRPPPADSVVSCGEGGILGPVVGVMGVLQALETIKLIAQPHIDTTPQPSLLLFSAYTLPQFRNVRLRSRRPDCLSCSAVATVTSDSLTSGSLDYVAFCGVTNPVSVLSPHERISPMNLSTSASPDIIILDVRDQTQFELCSLPNSINIPWPTLQQSVKDNDPQLHSLQHKHVVVLCKLGNDSQLAVQLLKNTDLQPKSLRDVNGGFRAWRNDVDPNWPDY